MNVLLYSGGYDSTVLKAMLDHHKVDTKLYHIVLKNKKDRAIINRAETDLIKKLGVKIDFQDSLELEKSEEYVPARNSLLVLKCANRLAHFMGKHTIYLGLIKNAEPFPDCTEEWVEAMNELLYIEFGGRIELVAPFVDLYKDFIYQIGNTLNVDISKTYSCNYENSNGEPCGKCGECEWRKGKETLKTYFNKKEWRDLNEQFRKIIED